jgi:4'-phosphopantetheinyl transferase
MGNPASTAKSFRFAAAFQRAWPRRRPYGSAVNLSSIVWPQGPLNPTLPENEVHVWAASLPALPHQLFSPVTSDSPAAPMLGQPASGEILSNEEKERAAQFRSPEDRLRFTRGRFFLRMLLGSYLGQQGAAVQLSRNRFGKPQLASTEDAAPLQFNLSCSGGIALLALTRVGPVGVDVERVDPRNLDAAQVIFRGEVHDRFQALPTGIREAAFHNAWTRKEAVLKAAGLGIGEHLPGVEVTFLPEERASINSLPPELAAPALWSLHHLAPAPGYVRAVAVQAAGHDIVLRAWEWRSTP